LVEIRTLRLVSRDAARTSQCASLRHRDLAGLSDERVVLGSISGSPDHSVNVQVIFKAWQDATLPSGEVFQAL
jgi:hypothetical protein